MQEEAEVGLKLDFRRLFPYHFVGMVNVPVRHDEIEAYESVELLRYCIPTEVSVAASMRMSRPRR